MLFKEVFKKLIVLFKSYKPKQNDVGTEKALERDAIVNFLKRTKRRDPLSPVDINECISFLLTKVTRLEIIRNKVKMQNPAEEELAAATLDGFTLTSIKVLTNLRDYWTKSVLSIQAQQDSLFKKALPLDTISVLIQSLQPVCEDELLGILQVQLILFMIDVDMRVELYNAPKSKIDSLYSGIASVFKLASSSVLPVYNHQAEDKLKPVVYKHLVKMKALLPTSQSDEARYMKFIDDALTEALGYEAQQSKGTHTQLKVYLTTASTRMAAFPALQKYRKNVAEMCEAVMKDSEEYASELALQKKPEESKRASISEESSEKGRRGSESPPSTTLPKGNTPSTDHSILTLTRVEAVDFQPETTQRSSLSEVHALLAARGSTSSWSPSASPFQLLDTPIENPSPLVLAEEAPSPAEPAQTVVHVANKKPQHQRKKT